MLQRFLRRPARLPALAALAVGLLAAACARPVAGPEVVLAVHSRGQITSEEYMAFVDGLRAAGELPPEGRGDWRAEALERLVVRAILADQAGDGSEVAAAAAAAADGALATAMRQHLGWTGLTVSAAQARAFYDAHRERFARPERLRLQHIFLRADAEVQTPGEREEVRRRLEAIRREIVAGADFGAMAREHSDSADGPAGGWMVLERDARAVRAFTDAAWALDPGEVSAPIETATGYHLVRLGTRIAPVERPFAEVVEQVAQEAVAAERRRLESDYLEVKGRDHGLLRHYDLLRGPVRMDDVLWSMGNEAFTTADLLARLPESLTPHVYAGYEPAVAAFLDGQALERVLVREAQDAELESRPEVRRAIERAVTAVRADFAIERRLGERAAAVTPADLRRLQARDRERYETPRRRSFSVIRLSPEPGELLWSLLRRGERMVAAIRRGADFATVGRAAAGVVYADDRRWEGWSDDDLVRRVLGRTRDLSRLENLEVGQLAEPLVGEVLDPASGHFEPTCVYILRLDASTPARPAPFAEAEGEIRADYLRQQRGRFLAELEREVLADAGLRILVDPLPGSRR